MRSYEYKTMNMFKETGRKMKTNLITLSQMLDYSSQGCDSSSFTKRKQAGDNHNKVLKLLFNFLFTMLLVNIN